MNIEISGLGKSFNNHRIFANLNYTFEEGQSYSLLGPNGSGKSTLLKILSGYMLPTTGSIEYLDNTSRIEPDDWYQYIVLATPYMELPEELTLAEFLNFHYQFKGLPESMDLGRISERCGLAGKESVQLKNFSSGMKQRLKLAISLFSRQKILLMDEPTVNLDENGIEWYLEEIRGILSKKLVIIASNSSIEHDFCQKSINLLEYK